MSLLKFFLLFRCVFESMLIINVNLGFHNLFGIKYMFISGVYSLYMYGSRSPFIFFNIYMFLRSVLWSISSF
jgi:hypothetical protein